MSWLGDIFGGDQEAAGKSQIQGLMDGLIGAQSIMAPNPGIITSYGAQALAPYQANTATATGGVNTFSPMVGDELANLNNLLGLGGPGGTASAMTALQNTPGYQFAKTQGDSSINAAQAASGQNFSGNQLKALSDYNSGLASQTYQNAVGNAQGGVQAAQGALNPFLSLLTPSATGQAGVLEGESSGLVGNNNLLAQLFQGTATGVGNAGANADLAKASAGQGLLGGALSLGSSLLGSLTGGLTGGLGGGLSGLTNLFGGGGAAGDAGSFAGTGGGLDSSFFSGPGLYN